MNRHALMTAVATALLCASTARAGMVELTTVRDNTLYEDSDGVFSNGAGDHFFAGNNGLSQPRRGLIAFDIAGSIPAGSTITSVSLQLNMSRTLPGSHPVLLYRLTADWGEGASNAPGEEGAGGLSQSGDATWIHTFYPGSFWANPGGDYVSTASASTVVGLLGLYTWTSPRMVTDVQAWVDDPGSNHGWIVIGTETSPGAAKRFDSREIASASLRPSLTISWDPPAPGACCFGDGSCSSLLQAACLDVDGTWQGTGTPCTPDPCCPADVNGSGTVDVDDLVAVIVAWGTADPDADIDGSGTVDVDDLVAVIIAWGPC